MTQPQQPDILEIIRHESLLRIAPQTGGRLLSWQIDGQPIIFWPTQADWSIPAKIRGGNPLLFPFIGRHQVDGRLGEWRDQTGVIRTLPVHGFARNLPFHAARDADGYGVSMTLTDSSLTHHAYPFTFRFEVTYRLVDTHMLDVLLSISNLGDTPMPYYTGHHFYFALSHALRGQTSIDLPRTHRCFQQEDGLISAAIPGESSYRLNDPRIHDRFHCFDGPLNQPVRIVSPYLQHSIEIDLARPSSIPWYAVTTWTETLASDFYCVEPWLGLPNAIHHGQGLRQLATGATETAALRITVKRNQEGHGLM